MAAARWASAASAALNLLLLLYLARLHVTAGMGRAEEPPALETGSAAHRCPPVVKCLPVVVDTSACTPCGPCSTESPTKHEKSLASLSGPHLSTASLSNSMLRAPLKPLFMGRISESHAMPFFEIEALTLPFRPNNLTFEVPSTLNSHRCSELCTNNTACAAWIYNKLNSSCFLHADPVNSRSWQIGLKSEIVSGNARRNFTVWVNPTYTLPRSNRTLLIVNWHWGTNAEKIIAYMVVNAGSFPADVDVVHATPNPQTSCLINVWSYVGYLSQISLLLAHVALPGYRGYLITNDDAYIVWNNMPLAFPHNSWHAGEKEKGTFYEVAVENISKDGPYRWEFMDPPPAPTRAKLNLPTTIGDRAIEALHALGLANVTHVWRTAGHCDVVYFCAEDMPLVFRWLLVMSSYGVFLEVATACTMNLGLIKQTHASIKYFAYQSVNANWRREFPWFYFDKKIAGSIHPTKLSNPDVRRWLYHVNEFRFGEPLGPGFQCTGKTCGDEPGFFGWVKP